MSSSFTKTKTEKVLSDREFLRELENRIGIRLMMFKDRYNEPECGVFLFGYTDQTRSQFFWLGTSISVVGLGGIKLEVWPDNISENLEGKFLSWEKKQDSMRHINHLTWWNKLVTSELFTCICASATDIKYDAVTVVEASDPRLQIFYGLLAAHINNYANDLKSAAIKYHGLKNDHQMAEIISKRLNGFVSKNYFDGFGIPDEM